MPELGQSRSPGGQLAPLRGPGPAWVTGARWGPARRLLCLQRLAPSARGGTQLWGTLGSAASLQMAPPDSWHRASTGPNFNGERRRHGLHPVSPIPGGGRIISRLPLLSLGREVPSAGPCYCSGAPQGWRMPPGPAAQHGRAVPQQAGAWPASLLSARNPKAQQRSA